MNLSQILEALPPRVYLRSGELVVQFSGPSDLVTRIAEAHAAFTELDRPENGRSDGKTRGGRTSSRSAGNQGAAGSSDSSDPSRASDRDE